MTVKKALTDFYNRYEQMCKKEIGHWQQVQQDKDWPSPCEIAGTEKVNLIQWKPVEQTSANDFSNIESALGFTLHQDIKDFYGSFYADNVNAKHERGEMNLLGVWSDKDVERLQQNVIGHLMMKDKLKQSLTVFIGLTDEDDLILSVDNETGAVVLEYVGKEPHQTVASSLAEFIDDLEPVL
ncbi:SecY-interacting protein [Flocculibacter collagenilyticus]|uniref:SecY-interacting protein n=1 Tax=Flocculibacter collagenilyticus TaxID=2744479 RepID=UPI0018F5452E|nr:SecY-interacting protein [Flocculibacter collagenilyticus]